MPIAADVSITEAARRSPNIISYITMYAGCYRDLLVSQKYNDVGRPGRRQSKQRRCYYGEGEEFHVSNFVCARPLPFLCTCMYVVDVIAAAIADTRWAYASRPSPLLNQIYAVTIVQDGSTVAASSHISTVAHSTHISKNN